ncbi:unnamed protein product [Polarella glacialis]|uniref:Uncharacterized protein n=1 Tax=Polarella glacialis TaxID=89957 RepID=A0A813LHW2_POLGL|nr:unnamed protein product [Polarella glacialis]CAE8728551.1 unnamed protein product [Polarella glacialis]
MSTVDRPSSWPVRRERQQLASTRKQDKIETLLSNIHDRMDLLESRLSPLGLNQDSELLTQLNDKVTCICNSLEVSFNHVFHFASFGELPPKPVLAGCSLQSLDSCFVQPRQESRQPDAEPSPARLPCAGDGHADKHSAVDVSPRCFFFDIGDNKRDQGAQTETPTDEFLDSLGFHNYKFEETKRSRVADLNKLVLQVTSGPCDDSGAISANPCQLQARIFSNKISLLMPAASSRVVDSLWSPRAAASQLGHLKIGSGTTNFFGTHA